MLLLEPIAAGLPFRRATIWIDRETYLTTKFEYVEADGDITRYTFENIRHNHPIENGRFTLALPPTVRVEAMKIQ